MSAPRSLAASARSKRPGPKTVDINIGVIKRVIQHAAAMHGLPVSVEPINLGRIALNRLGLVGHTLERDRRPTQEALKRLIANFANSPGQIIPMGRITKFAVAAVIRQEEVCRPTSSDLNIRTKMLTIRTASRPDSEGDALYVREGSYPCYRAT